MPKLEIRLICHSESASQYVLDKVLEVVRSEPQVTVAIVKDLKVEI